MFRAARCCNGPAPELGVLAFGNLPNFGISSALAADLGSGDIGILNYAYALEQLEAAFYTMVIDSPYARHQRRRKDYC